MTCETAVLMLVYNHAEWLPKSLDSLLAQTYQDYSLLVVDDGSSDDSLKVVRSYEKKFKNCEVVANQTNKGPIENFHYSFSLIRKKYFGAKYFLLACPDDTWSPDYLDKIVSALEADTEAVVCQTGYDMTYVKNGKKTEHMLHSLDTKNYREASSLFRSHGTPGAKTHYNNMLHGVIRFSEMSYIYPPTKRMLGASLVIEISMLIAMLLRGKILALPEILYHKKKLGTYEEIYGSNDFTRKRKSLIYRTYALCLCLPWFFKIRKEGKGLIMVISLWLHLVYYYGVLKTYENLKNKT